MTQLDLINESAVAKLKETLAEDFLGLILFGSGNNQDFVHEISDIDYFLILKTLDDSKLKKINECKEDIMNMHLMPVDIKVITIKELKYALEGNASCEFFNGWGIEAIKKEHQKIIYDSCNIHELFKNSNIPLEKFCDERLIYYLHKMRKIIQGQKHLFHNNIKSLNEEEQYKIIVSCIKNVLVFHLALKGIFVYTNEELLTKIQDKELKLVISKTFQNKQSGKYNQFDLLLAYNLVEKYINENLEMRK